MKLLYPWYCCDKGTSAPTCHIFQRAGGNSPVMPPLSGVPTDIHETLHIADKSYP